MRAKADAQRESFAGGGVDEDQLRAALHALHEDTRTKMATILTADQMKKLDAMQDERFEKRMQRRADNAGNRNDAHLAWLVRTLELSDAQAAQVRAALAKMQDAGDAALKGVQSGSQTRDQAHEQMRTAHDAFAQTLKGILSAEQAQRLDILRPLIPGPNHHA
jgi:Spy/CpxP family protein refolding chaperone